MAKPPWHTPVNKTELVCFTCTNVWSSEDSSKGIYSANQILPKGATEGGASPAGPPPDSEIVDELRAYPWYGTASTSCRPFLTHFPAPYHPKRAG